VDIQNRGVALLKPENSTSEIEPNIKGTWWCQTFARRALSTGSGHTWTTSWIRKPQSFSDHTSLASRHLQGNWRFHDSGWFSEQGNPSSWIVMSSMIIHDHPQSTGYKRFPNLTNHQPTSGVRSHSRPPGAMGARLLAIWWPLAAQKDSLSPGTMLHLIHPRTKWTTLLYISYRFI